LTRHASCACAQRAVVFSPTRFTWLRDPSGWHFCNMSIDVLAAMASWMMRANARDIAVVSTDSPRCKKDADAQCRFQCWHNSAGHARCLISQGRSRGCAPGQVGACSGRVCCQQLPHHAYGRCLRELIAMPLIASVVRSATSSSTNYKFHCQRMGLTIHLSTCALAQSCMNGARLRSPTMRVASVATSIPCSRTCIGAPDTTSHALPFRRGYHNRALV